MIGIKRNSREFKDIKEIFDDYEFDAARKKLILLYSLKAYESLDKKVLLNKLKGSEAVVYQMSYENVKDYLRDRSKKYFAITTKRCTILKHQHGANGSNFRSS